MVTFLSGARFTISTDVHHPKHLLNMRHGVTMARRAWLGPEDILNTRQADQFAQALRRA
jgi:DNA polymerase (family 10)